MRVDFYHLQRSTLEQALPKLASLCYSRGLRLLIKTSLSDRAEHLNGLLWTFDPNSWIPHGSEKDGNETEQPVFITTGEANPNGATVVMLTEGGALDEIRPFERCLNLFDGRDEEAVQKARELWKAVVAEGFEAYYWQQNDRGQWEMKASKVPETQEGEKE